jgi:hypothetical protein
MATELSDERVLFFKNTKLMRILLVLVFILVGIGVRLVDLSDPPLDFAATRQLHSLVLARGYYYALDVPSTQTFTEAQKEFGMKVAANETLDEPPILEHITAYIYALVGKEDFEIPRVMVSLLWVIGGIPLFLLMRKITSTNGAVFALAFYELLPFGVIASRSFQPDPVMVTLILFALYYQFCWMQEHNLKNALLAGGFTCLAVISKVPAVFFAGIPFIGLVLSDGFKKAFRNWQVYLMAAISLLPSAIYYILNATVGNNSTELFGTRFFPALYTQPHWYQSWFMMAKSVVGYIPIFLAILAFFLIKQKENKILYGCLWLGYLMQGIVLAYHVYSHNYYHLPIIPIVAMGCGLVFAILMDKIQSLQPDKISRIFMIAVLLFGAALCALKSRSDLLSADYRYEETYWKKLGDTIGANTPIIALTHDYGLRLSYWGNILPRLWMTQGDFTVVNLMNSPEKPFATRFEEATKGCDYFLVTLINDFDSQKDLHDYLLAHYPYTQGEGYYLFDLKHPLTTSNS